MIFNEDWRVEYLSRHLTRFSKCAHTPNFSGCLSKVDIQGPEKLENESLVEQIILYFFLIIPLQPLAFIWLQNTPWQKTFGNEFSKRAADVILFSVTLLFNSFLLICNFSWCCWTESLYVKSQLYCTQLQFFSVTCIHQNFSQCIYLTPDPNSAVLPRCYQCSQLLLRDHQTGKEVGLRGV